MSGVSRTSTARNQGSDVEDHSNEIVPGARVADDSAVVAALVVGAAAGDQSAWRGLVERYQGMIAAVGRRYGLSAADAAELQQATWLKLVEHIGRIQQPERVGAWLATTAKRESLHILRKSSRYTTGRDQALPDLPDADAAPLDAGPIADEQLTILREALSRMPIRSARLLQLVMDDTLSYKQLSEILGMPIGSIGPTRGRCLEHLRRIVAELGLTAD